MSQRRVRMTACLARSSSPLRPTTQSFGPEDFPETAEKPAIGGLLRLRFRLRGDRFWPECDFGPLCLWAEESRFPDADRSWAIGGL
jgi:hypothetical protein